MSLTSSTLALLAQAQALLTGATVAKAIPSEPAPDAQADPNAQANPDEAALEAARQEAAKGQAAQAPAPGEEGAPGEGGDPGAGGEGDDDEPGDGDGDGEVMKAEVLKGMRFMAQLNGLSDEEVVKAFTGCEGDPSKTSMPVIGKGEEFLEKLLTGSQEQGRVLEAISSAILELARNQVSLGEVAKSFEAVAARQASLEAQVSGLPKTAPAAAAKAATEIAKAEPSTPVVNHQSLFDLALAGKLSPEEAAGASRQVTYCAQ